MTFSNQPHSALSLMRIKSEEDKKDISKILDEFLKTPTAATTSEKQTPEKPEYKRKYIQSPRTWDANVDILNSLVNKVHSLETQREEDQIKTEYLFTKVQPLSEKISQLLTKNEQLANELEKIKKQKPWQSEFIHWMDSNKILVGIYLTIPGAGWGVIEFLKWLLK